MPIEESKETLLGTSLRRSRTHSSSRISSCAHLNLRGPSPSPVQCWGFFFFFQSCFCLPDHDVLPVHSSEPPRHPPPTSLLFSSDEGWVRPGGKEGTQSVGGEGGVGEWRESSWNVGQSGSRRFHGNSVHSSSDIIRTGEATKWGNGEGGGCATEMTHPDWLGVKRDSLRPLWSSAISWSEDKDGGGGCLEVSTIHRTSMKIWGEERYLLFWESMCSSSASWDTRRSSRGDW